MLCAEGRKGKGFFSYEPGSPDAMIHNDHLATPQKMTDSSGAVVWAADYKPFGEATITVSTITNNLRFPGQYFDAETGLNYNYFRDYNPAIGRYIEKDPIGIRRGKNHLYAYVGNNPIRRIDSLGLDDLDFSDYGVDVSTLGMSPMWPTPINYFEVYDYAHEVRIWGQNQFRNNSPMRHCVISCMVASHFGTPPARVAGTANEIQGLRLDIRDLWGRVSGERPWAFQWQDFRDNERGFRCSQQNDNNMNEDQIRQSCIQRCQGQ